MPDRLIMMPDRLFIPLIVMFLVMAFLFWAAQLLDVLPRKDDDFPGRNDKMMWGLIVFFGGFLGAIVYSISKQPRTSVSAAKYLRDARANDESEVLFPSENEDASDLSPDDDDVK